jgi:hypothetical protein
LTNVLDPFDQAFVCEERASGITNALQVGWMYNRPISVDGLRQFHDHLRRGPVCRRIQRSPLPFGRDRWVALEDQPELEIVATPRPREQFEAWLDEQAETPLDAEHGPVWRCAVLPFTDGGAGMSAIASHCVIDGVGFCQALVEAACGHDNAIDWPTAASRRRWRALREDAGQTVRDLPSIGRATVAAARFLRENIGRDNNSSTGPASPPPATPAAADERIALPAVTTFIDAEQWECRARALGGTENTLLAAFVAQLSRRMGRVAADGSVTLLVPINERTVGDNRANAVTAVEITVAPTLAATDLRELRATMKDALIRSRETPYERLALLPLAPVVPQRLMKRLGDMDVDPGRSVASNIGTAPRGLALPDGADADHVAGRTVVHANRSTMDRRGGLLVLSLGILEGEIALSTVAYRPYHRNSKDDLRQHLRNTLSDFSLTATIGWPV